MMAVISNYLKQIDKTQCACLWVRERMKEIEKQSELSIVNCACVCMHVCVQCMYVCLKRSIKWVYSKQDFRLMNFTDFGLPDK